MPVSLRTTFRWEIWMTAPFYDTYTAYYCNVRMFDSRIFLFKKFTTENGSLLENGKVNSPSPVRVNSPTSLTCLLMFSLKTSWNRGHFERVKNSLRTPRSINQTVKFLVTKLTRFLKDFRLAQPWIEACDNNCQTLPSFEDIATTVYCSSGSLYLSDI